MRVALLALLDEYDYVTQSRLVLADEKMTITRSLMDVRLSKMFGAAPLVHDMAITQLNDRLARIDQLDAAYVTAATRMRAAVMTTVKQ